MNKIATAQRVSLDASDNFVFQRSILAYHQAAKRVSGRVLEIGTGSGYGIEVIAPSASQFVTVDKHMADSSLLDGANVEFRQAIVPPLPFDDASFDFVISFQVIEHIKDDQKFVAEIHRVLKAGGQFIVSTPNKTASLTRNPWHIREYTPAEFSEILSTQFNTIECFGVFGNQKVMEYYQHNKRGVERITRFDIFNFQHHLPRWILRIPYDILNRLNRSKLLKENSSLTTSITMSDYTISPIDDEAFDLFYIATK